MTKRLSCSFTTPTPLLFVMIIYNPCMLLLPRLLYFDRSWVLIGPGIDTVLVMPSTCISEIGIAVGAVTVVESVIVSVIAIIVVLCLWR